MTIIAAPCITCGQPHQWTEARGFYAEDGHAYRQITLQDFCEIPAFPPRLFGVLAECPACACLVENTRAAIARHATACELLDDMGRDQ